MKVFEVEYDRMAYWSHTDLAYIKHDAGLMPFMEYAPTPEGLTEAIEARKRSPVNRELWLRVIKKQYASLGFSLPVEEAILVDENTFTVNTAHQPTLLTGPLFHLYKIASTIHLARQLKADHPDQQFIPVFILGSEDHDWAEINHFYVFGKKIEWERAAGGSGGRMDLTGLNEVIDQVNALFTNSPFGTDIAEMLTTALHKSTSYGQFHQALLITLFQQHGLLVFNLDDADLKKTFIPIFEKEIREQFSKSYVAPTQALLEQAGFKPQAYCRPINMFYMTPGRRERIDPAEQGVILAEQKKAFTLSEIVDELHAHPEQFSPNVVMRPLYQESILPSIAYVGGGGEIAYWLERKSQFKAAGIPFPVLIRRNSILTIDESTAAQIEKADLIWEELLEDYDQIVKSFLIRHNGDHLSYEAEENMIHEAYAALAKKAERVDPTLSKAILAEESKQVKLFDQLGARIMRAEKQQQETQLKRIQKLKEKLFPEGKLQERHDNFLPFYASAGPAFISALIEVCNPMDERFKILML